MVAGAVALRLQSSDQAAGFAARVGRCWMVRGPDTINGVDAFLGFTCNCAVMPSSDPYIQ